MLSDAWIGAVVALGGDGTAARGTAAELERRYAEPQRRYHTGAHVEAVLRTCRELGEAVGLGGRERDLLVLAACAHDVIYDLQPGADERASAVWAGVALAAAGVAGADAARVEQLIALTAEHRAPDRDLAAAVLLDADLAILGSAPADYDAYARAVRAEYAAVSESLWRRGRGDVLQRLLAARPLYRTEPARRRWDEPARANLARELAALRI